MQINNIHGQQKSIIFVSKYHPEPMTETRIKLIKRKIEDEKRQRVVHFDKSVSPSENQDASAPEKELSSDYVVLIGKTYVDFAQFGIRCVLVKVVLLIKLKQRLNS